MIPKTLDLSAPIMTAFAQRYSGVCFDPDRPLSDGQLLSLAEAARWAPSCFGDQPWRYLICDRHRDPEAWQRAWDCLAEGNQPWCRLAPVLLITCADTRFTRNDKPNRFGGHDKARASFAIPERFEPMAMMALGYQLPEERLPEEFRNRELAPRQRNPLEQHFFLGSWGKGLKKV
jgi:nitroreductase